MDSPVRVLVVEDYDPIRHFLLTTLRRNARFEIIGEASNGIDAIQKLQSLKPELILLDIGLPELNGIEVARQVRSFSPKTKILVISENRSWDIVQEALRSGADGYVLKNDAGRELLHALESVLQGVQFISKSLGRRDLTRFSGVHGENQIDRDNQVAVTGTGESTPDCR